MSSLWVRKTKSLLARFQSRKSIFTKIYRSNAWGSEQSRSGVGSEVAHTAALRAALPELVSKYQIASLLDLPCGDFNWMRLVDLRGTSYVGGDIVEAIIDNNIRRYASPTVSFRKLDILAGELPKCDLIMVRDLFNHFATRDVLRSLGRINEFGFKYLLVGHYQHITHNCDTRTGGSRPINFRLSPFGFPEPLELIEEDYMPHRELGRSMAMWRLPVLTGSGLLAPS